METAHDTEQETMTWEDLAEAWCVDTDALRYWGENQHMDAEEASTHFSYEFEDAYVGQVSIAEYAQSIAESHTNDPWLLRYFDYDALENDLLHDGMWQEDGHLFRW